MKTITEKFTLSYIVEANDILREIMGGYPGQNEDGLEPDSLFILQAISGNAIQVLSQVFEDISKQTGSVKKKKFGYTYSISTKSTEMPNQVKPFVHEQHENLARILKHKPNYPEFIEDSLPEPLQNDLRTSIINCFELEEYPHIKENQFECYIISITFSANIKTSE